jgi:hypothetical protein
MFKEFNWRTLFFPSWKKYIGKCYIIDYHIFMAISSFSDALSELENIPTNYYLKISHIRKFWSFSLCFVQPAI